MATATLPRRQGITRGRWLGAGIFLIILVIIAALAINSRRTSSTTVTVATTAVTSGSVVASIAGSGSVAAGQALGLPFQARGRVTPVREKKGDPVPAAQPLAQLDTRDLQLQVASAQAALDSANTK